MRGIRQHNGLSEIYKKSFIFTQKRNIYVVAAFEPEDYTRPKRRSVYDNFNPDGNILLLGGQFDKQALCTISNTDAKSTLPYNTGIMYYRHQYYPILMPCGELTENDVDEDEESIF